MRSLSVMIQHDADMVLDAELVVSTLQALLARQYVAGASVVVQYDLITEDR